MIPILKLSPAEFDQYKECEFDSYSKKKNCKLIKKEDVEYGTYLSKSKSYSISIYEKSHTFSWKFKLGLAAFFATIFTGFIGLLFPRVQNLWSKAFSGKSIKQIKVPLPSLKSLEVPLKAGFAYKGSNAEYLVLNARGEACSFEEYQEKTAPVIAQRFPRPKMTIEEESLAKLQKNEAEAIETKLKAADLTPIKIPKTLYDLFYWRFHIEDSLEGKHKPEDCEKIKAAAQKKFEEGKAKSPHPSIEKILKLYSFNKKGSGEISINTPILDFRSNKNSAGPAIERLYMKRESEENYQKVCCELNRRILAYMKDHQVDAKDLSWENMHKIATSLLEGIDKLKDNKGLYNHPTFGDFGDFSRKYCSYQKRINQGILGAIWHEYRSAPDVYTVYRSANPYMDDKTTETPHSFSFGHSPLGGIQYDGSTGSPIGFIQNDLVAVDVKISDYERGGEASKFIFIPPARGINRIVEKGETCHVRSKIMLMKDSPKKVTGFFGAVNSGFLEIPAKTEQEEAQHIKATRVFLKSMRTIIVGDEI